MAKLGALLTALVTPFNPDGSVNEDVVVQLMHDVVDQGSDGIVICGTTGEVSTLSDQEHLALIELAVKELKGKATVVAGVGSNDTKHAVHLTEQATLLGADGMLSVTPYYNKPNRRGIIAHFKAVAEATDKPVILYNIPGRTAVDMPNDLLAELAQIDQIDAVKQSRDSDLALIDGLELYAGNDDMLAKVLDLGGVGGICVVSHIFGKEMRAIIDQPERRAELMAALEDANEALAVTTNPIPIKAALNLLGINVGGLRLPLLEASPSELAVIKAMLTRYQRLNEVRTAA